MGSSTYRLVMGDGMPTSPPNDWLQLALGLWIVAASARVLVLFLPRAAADLCQLLAYRESRRR